MKDETPSKLPRVVVTAPLPGGALALFERRARVEVMRRRGLLGEAELAAALRGAAGAVTLLTDPVTRAVLEACPGLKVVSNVAVGTDNIDLEAARERGIVVTHTPGVLTEATADLAWALILGVARRIGEGERLVRAGGFAGWAPDLLLGVDLRGKILGVVGMGHIGRAVARRAPAFGMRVVYSQPRRLQESVESALCARHLPLEELLAAADVVSLHCPLTPETRRLMDRRRLLAMKPGAILVNTARGPVVDEEALVECLREGRLFGAGLDVYEREPALAEGLTELPNVLLLPHLGSATEGVREAMARMAVTDCLAVLEGRRPEHGVL
ncbi:MAG: 2-hydroxyacid dehydrogenase [Acidobacteriota bacterium]